MSRRHKEFNDYTKQACKERANFVCEICGKSNDLSVHHICSIHFMKERHPEVDRNVVASLDNAMLLCAEHHFLMHITDQEFDIMEDHYQEVLSHYSTALLAFA